MLILLKWLHKVATTIALVKFKVQNMRQIIWNKKSIKCTSFLIEISSLFTQAEVSMMVDTCIDD